MTESIYSKHNIDPNKLSRDYLTNPLIKVNNNSSEKPNKEDLFFLYIELNLSYKELKDLFGWSKSVIIRWNRKYNINKGGHNLARARETCLTKYGCESPFSNKLFKEKSLTTKLQRYGDEKYNNRDKAKSTCIEKYGRSNVGYFGSQEHIKAVKEKYGQDNYTKTDEYKNLFKNKEWVKEMNDKKYLTMKKNNSFNKSSPEDKYYNQLVEKYGRDGVIRQYKSELYPFNCDFYIPSKDLYIEYNGHWGHHTEPYDPSNKEHQLLLEKWKSNEKESERVESGKKSYYTYAIEVWTIRDPLKRETVKNNSLNFIEIW